MILATRWRIFRRSVVARPEKTTALSFQNVVLVVKAACVLHNFLQQDNQSNDTDGRAYCPPQLVDSYDNDGKLLSGAWREEGLGTLQPLSSHANRYSQTAAGVRDTFARYFMSPSGAVNWQMSVVSSTGPRL